jgi:hypothetical protein
VGAWREEGNDIPARGQLVAHIGNCGYVRQEESYSHPDIFAWTSRLAWVLGKSISCLGTAPMAANLLVRDGH